jgi:flagellar protein FliS
MLAMRNPREAYRRVDFDARAQGAGPAQLVALCFDQADAALSAALYADAAGDNAAKSHALTRALSAIVALQLGVAGNEGVASALHRFYDGMRHTLLDSAIRFDAEAIAAARSDLAEVAQALTRAKSE